ncbi:MAG: double-strand break repair helicase AddA [Asticcacaulis sp.]|uniref:double-strand break repair helicase AddA n=1 Tax=Asticcacaulis sp. TaxID=1872648 RepID=UPI003F7C96F2
MAKAQNQAADPKANVFVTANAGSGKTSTLVNRVARLLLNGARPERILCVTYTKAAAAEMQGRLFERLGGWAVADDADLAADLAGIDEATHDLGRARALFASALETPGGLKIQTLHAFCEKLLRRFPLEAGLSPAFEIMDDLKGRALAQAAISDLLTLDAPDVLVEARTRLIRKLKTANFEKLIGQFVMQHEALRQRFEAMTARADWRDELFRRLGLASVCTTKDCLDAYVARLEWQVIRDLAATLSSGSSKTNRDAGQAFLDLHVRFHQDGHFDLDLIRGVFLTGKGEPRKNPYTKETAAADALLMDRLGRDILELIETLKAAEIAQDTLDAVLLFGAFSGIYQTRKQAEGALDFSDLIERAKALLLTGDMSLWVLFKLDGGLEHILVDEAQDTSEDQWHIVEALSGEFYSGRESETARTVFAVGDEKQSIYGFQGARPEIFLEKSQTFEALARGAGQKFVAPDLVESWRTLPELLGFVDAVFGAPELAAALNFTGKLIRHQPRREGPHGFVELWPQVQPIDAPERDADDLDAPVDQPVSDPAARRLARQIAGVVRDEIRAGRAVYEKKTETPRPLHAGDVLILVRKRDALFEHIIRELKMAGVPVSGADRLKLADHIAFQDLRALMRFCLRQQDDLALACVLRSPLCDLSEDDLFILAHGRAGSLWRALREHGDDAPRFAEARSLLAWAARLSRSLSGFDFLSRVLNRRDAAGRSIKQRFLTRLGDECEDVLEETLALALQGESAGEGGLAACLDLFEFRAAQVKREQEEGARSVRVMTVHGSKGLEAPWVILPIGPQHMSARNDDLLITGADELYLTGKREGDVARIAALRDDKAARDEQEGLRLLYVALTRARDRLTLCGFAGKKTPKAGRFPGWYDLLDQAFGRVDDAAEVIRLHAPFDDQEMMQEAAIRTYGQRSPALTPEAEAVTPRVALPAFALNDVPQAEVDLERWRAVSQMGDEERDEDERAPSPLAQANGLGRYRRGELIHKLFEILPEVAPDSRADIAARYLMRQPDLTPAQRQEMAQAVLTVLKHERFAEAFGPGSKPEVALAGQIGVNASGEKVMLSGRIDRLVIAPDRVLIIDYKSNRPAPDRAEDAAIAYQRQMAGYVALLRQIHPDKAVEAALLWTDGPKLTPLSEALVNLRLNEILAR